MSQIRAHIAWKTDVNQKNVNGDDATPLYLATLWNHTDAALLLLAAGADPNIPSRPPLGPCCDAPLHVVKSPVLAKALLDHGADVSARNGTGSTPVSFAIWPLKSQAIVELELARGADLNAGSGLDTPILRAVMDPAPDTALIHYLLAHGARANVQTSTGWTLIALARDAEGSGRAPGLTAIIEPYLTSPQR